MPQAVHRDVGTVFEDSHIAPNVWLQAIYLIGASKKGISAHRFTHDGHHLSVGWFMMHRLRYAMSVQPLAMLTGTVEVDETTSVAVVAARSADARNREIAQDRCGRPRRAWR
jgi:hypothetical protein